ncbi:MAG: segregation/condensation protein A, partial [Cyanobacteria bacterium SZAS LIN-2]|nr:segregation/condensation protein A [Cyanobacteria bacterium SZAS LIN-2]
MSNENEPQINFSPDAGPDASVAGSVDESVNADKPKRKSTRAAAPKLRSMPATPEEKLLAEKQAQAVAKSAAKEAKAVAKEARAVEKEIENLEKAQILDFSTDNSGAAGSGEPLAHPDSGIEILVKMAEKGEIDPKNVDIIDVCDKFLKAIASTPKESLRMSGKVIFHAAVLLRLKAEALLSEATNTLTPVVDDFLDFDADGGPILYDSNKQEIG